MTKVTLSSKGQVVLPSKVRRAHQWTKGTKLIVDDRPDGVMLRSADTFPRTRIDDVFGIAHYDGSAKSIEDMNATIDQEARRRK